MEIEDLSGGQLRTSNFYINMNVHIFFANLFVAKDQQQMELSYISDVSEDIVVCIMHDF